MEKHNLLFVSSIIICICLIFIYFFVLPDKQIVPIHYNINGTPNYYGEKQYLLILPVINIVLIILLHFLTTKPQILNYPIKITKQNRTQTYSKMKLFLGVTTLFITIIFAFIFINSSGIINKIS